MTLKKKEKTTDPQEGEKTEKKISLQMIRSPAPSSAPLRTATLLALCSLRGLSQRHRLAPRRATPKDCARDVVPEDPEASVPFEARSSSGTDCATAAVEVTRYTVQRKWEMGLREICGIQDGITSLRMMY